MTFWMLAGALTLSSFAAVAVLASFAVGSIAPAVAARIERRSPASRAAVFFRLRVLPAVLAMLIAFGVALPVFLVFEPKDAGESMPRTLALLASAGAVLVARSALAALGAWRATTRVRRAWEARGRPLQGFEARLPLFAIDEPFPTVAVVGVARPALFISERVLRECTTDEIEAMLRHETAHVTVRDNLKRFVIRACPDVLGRESALDRAWSRAAEEAADAAAIAGRPATAVELAQALIRVARLAPASNTPALASAFYLGGSIEARIRQLLAPTGATEAPTPLGCVLLGGGVLAAAILVIAGGPMIHQALEVLVRSLP